MGLLCSLLTRDMEQWIYAQCFQYWSNIVVAQHFSTSSEHSTGKHHNYHLEIDIYITTKNVIRRGEFIEAMLPRLDGIVVAEARVQGSQEEHLPL